MTTSGKIYVPESAEEIRADILGDLELEAFKAGIDVAVAQGSDEYVWATAMANALMLAHANVALNNDDQSIFEASGKALDQHREAHGLPEIGESAASGKIAIKVLGQSANFAGGEEFVYPNGFRGKVLGSWPGLADGSEIDVGSVDRGADANLPGGEKVRLVAPPPNVAAEATVSLTEPLRGGTGEEDDDSKQRRILDHLRHPPAGGNWAHKRKLSREALAQIEDAFVYPALGGPASEKIVPIGAFDFKNRIFTRALPDPVLDVVKQTIWAESPTPMEIVVQSVIDEPLDAALGLALGGGIAWRDATPWPDSSLNRVLGEPTSAITSINGSTLTVAVNIATAPALGQRIMWWAPTDLRFYEGTVSSVGGLQNAWELTLQAPLADSRGSAPAVGDLISAAVTEPDVIGEAWITACARLGPGENTWDPHRLPRALRHPTRKQGWPSDVGSDLFLGLLSHPAIQDLAAVYSNTMRPTVPASVAEPPRVLVPRHFAIYAMHR